MADAAYGADYPRDFIVEELGASEQIKRNPTRTARKAIDRTLYKEPHAVERFFNGIERFRRIVPRREKTVSSFRAVLCLAYAMAWLA